MGNSDKSDGWVMDMVINAGADGQRPLREILSRAIRQKLYESNICYVETLLLLTESELAKVPNISARDVAVIIRQLTRNGYRLLANDERRASDDDGRPPQ